MGGMGNLHRGFENSRTPPETEHGIKLCGVYTRFYTANWRMVHGYGVGIHIFLALNTKGAGIDFT